MESVHPVSKSNYVRTQRQPGGQRALRSQQQAQQQLCSRQRSGYCDCNLLKMSWHGCRSFAAGKRA